MIVTKIHSSKSSRAALVHITIDNDHVVIIDPKVWCRAALAARWLLAGSRRQKWYACATHTNQTGPHRPCTSPVRLARA
jgi:hypothetical protein